MFVKSLYTGSDSLLGGGLSGSRRFENGHVRTLIVQMSPAWAFARERGEKPRKRSCQDHIQPHRSLFFGVIGDSETFGVSENVPQGGQGGHREQIVISRRSTPICLQNLKPR